MKKINLVLSVLVVLLVLAGCDKNPAEVKEKDPDVVLGGEEKNLFVGEWYEVSSTDDYGAKVFFTETTMSIIGYGFIAADPTIWMDSLTMYTQDLGYKVLSDSELEFAHRPPRCIELPNYKVNYTFKSADTLFIKKIWANSVAQVYPPFLSNILLCRRKNNEK